VSKMKTRSLDDTGLMLAGVASTVMVWSSGVLSGRSGGRSFEADAAGAEMGSVPGMRYPLRARPAEGQPALRGR
jgi:hypothetical protein